MISLRFRFMLKNAGCALAGIALLLALAGCSPSYNWRELLLADGRIQAAFPAKVQAETRDLDAQGTSLRFTLSSARVGDGVFAVGHAPLPPGLPARTREQLAEGVQRSLYARIGAAPPAAWPAPGTVLHARSAEGEPARWMYARVWVDDGLLVQAVAVGTVAGLPEAEARTFLASIKRLPL